MVKKKNYFSSETYWKNRYAGGGNSGPGSYSHLAEFKAKVLNEFVCENKIKSVIELGCGDGNQLLLAKYPNYTGYDISPTAIELCASKFNDDPNKEFHLLHLHNGKTADLAISLDVIFHLTEDSVFENYMRLLFNSADRYVAIYSSNFDAPPSSESPHVRHRNFASWVSRNMSATWTLHQHTPNLYPYDGDYKETSFCDFYFYRKLETQA
jgi:SAM-dependent methyltransferase